MSDDEIEEREQPVLTIDLRNLDDEGDKDYRRPKLAVTVDMDPLHEFPEPAIVCLTVYEGWGHPTIYIEMTPLEARELGENLLAISKHAEQELEHKDETVVR